MVHIGISTTSLSCLELCLALSSWMLASDWSTVLIKMWTTHWYCFLGSNNACSVPRDLEFATKTSFTAPHTQQQQPGPLSQGWTGPCFHVVLRPTRPECEGRTLDSSDLATFFIFHCPAVVKMFELCPWFPVRHLASRHPMWDFHVFLASLSWPHHDRVIGLADFTLRCAR